MRWLAELFQAVASVRYQWAGPPDNDEAVDRVLDIDLRVAAC